MGQIETGQPALTILSPLADPWPGFLDLVDTEPERAWEEFYVFAWRLVRLRAPAAFRDLPPDDQDDVLEDVLQALQANGFRQLRSYENLGHPFAVWFWKVLRNRALDHMKYARRRAHESLTDLQDPLADLAANPEVRTELAELVVHVEAALDRLSPQCQLLLKAAAEGYTPKELQLLLGLGPGENKRLSDQLRYCRRRLVDELGAAGVTVDLDP